MCGCSEELVRAACGEELQQSSAGIVNAGWNDRAKSREGILMMQMLSAISGIRTGCRCALLGLLILLPLVGQDPSTSRKAPPRRLLVYMYPDRMLPAELRVPPGEYLIRVENNATVGAVPLDFSKGKIGAKGETVAAQQLKDKSRRWNQTVTLQKGEYVVSCPLNQKWAMTILVDPAYPEPVVQ